jgi:hypothetical protein
VHVQQGVHAQQPEQVQDALVQPYELHNRQVLVGQYVQPDDGSNLHAVHEGDIREVDQQLTGTIVYDDFLEPSVQPQRIAQVRAVKPDQVDAALLSQIHSQAQRVPRAYEPGLG